MFSKRKIKKTGKEWVNTQNEVALHDKQSLLRVY